MKGFVELSQSIAFWLSMTFQRDQAPLKVKLLRLKFYDI